MKKITFPKIKPSKNKKYFLVSAIIVLLAATTITVFNYAKQTKAEQSGDSPESGATSRIKEFYDDLFALGFGSDSSGSWGDWGSYWNRAQSAARWVPSGDATTDDVKSGNTFYSESSRTEQTGEYPNPTSCSTEAYHDSYGAPVTQTTNCVADISWTTPDPAVTGDDKQDERTGVIWSKYLKNNAGTVEFADTGGSQWSWDASGANNIAVGNKTASQLCSERGNGWRLPTQKELMQAYIDGSYWNLTNPSNAFWSATEASSTNAWLTSLSTGNTSNLTKTTATYYVRCVR